MSDKKISALPVASTLTGSESVPIVQAGNTVKTTVDSISEYVSDTVKPYKVYTALLTQSGGNNPIQTSGDEAIVKGVTYTIAYNPDNIDISSIGAPNNNVGTAFVSTRDASGEFSTTIKLDNNTGAPVVTVLENTIGDIWFTYNAAGSYSLNSLNVFLEDKYFAPMPLSLYDESVNQGGGGGGYNWVRLSDSIVIISVLGAGDNQLNNTPIEIRVYN